MLKQVLVATTVAVSSSAALAGTMGTPCAVYNYQVGPYVGASVGPQDNLASLPAFAQGLEGTLSIGWGQVWPNRFYLAGEFFGGGPITLAEGKIDGRSTSIASSYSYGFDAIPGIMLTDHVLGYVRAGVVRTQFDNISQGSTGWQVGIGGQTNLYRRLDIRGEYIYSQYSRINSSVSGTTFSMGIPRINQFNVGLIYKFGA